MKVIIDQTELISVAPVGQAQPWWPVLLRLLISQPALLPNSPTLLTDPTDLNRVHPTSSSPGRVSHLYERLQAEGIPTNVADLLIAATRTSTHKTYESSWNRWCRWCSGQQIDPLSSSISNILIFLTEALASLDLRHCSVLQEGVSFKLTVPRKTWQCR